MGDRLHAKGRKYLIQLVLLSIMNFDVRTATFQLHKCSKTVWRPGSARTRWASSQRSLRPLIAGCGGRFAAGVGGKGERRGGKVGKEGWEREGKKEMNGREGRD
jgi:hypothetical protein